MNFTVNSKEDFTENARLAPRPEIVSKAEMFLSKMGRMGAPFPKFQGPRRRSRARAPIWAVMGAVSLAVSILALTSACAEPVVRKRSFMSSARGVHKDVEVPSGLNPLGTLDTCRPGAEALPPLNRVLVSRPEFFTEEASLMISALREVLAEPENEIPAVEFWLTGRAIRSGVQAEWLGRHCGALIVLWEPRQTKTLEITLPHPAQIPLRPLVRRRLCEFGSHREQLNILVLTIAGLLAMRENDYERAVFFMNSARAATIDTNRPSV